MHEKRSSQAFVGGPSALPIAVTKLERAPGLHPSVPCAASEGAIVRLAVAPLHWVTRAAFMTRVALHCCSQSPQNN